MKTTAAPLSKIEVLLRDRQYDRALDALSSIDRSMLDRQDCGWWDLLFAEAMLFKGCCEDVENHIREPIEIFRHDSDTAKYAMAKFLLGWMYALRGDFVAAIEAYIDANSHYDRCGLKRACARTLNKLAYPQFQLGQMDAAIRNVNRAIALLRELGESRVADSYSGNLAALLFRAGRLSDAVACYSDLTSDVEQRHGRTALILYQTAAAAIAQNGDIAAARKTIAKCKPYLDDYPREKAIYFENLGLINILDGKYSAAEKALAAGLEISLEIAPESALVSQIKRLYGDLYVATEQWEKAEKYAREGLAVAEKIGQRVEIAACHRILGQVETHRGDREAAREAFDKAIEIFDQIGSAYELAVARYEAAASGVYHAIDSVGMLWAAKKYFRSEDVKPYLTKVESLLAELPPPRPAIVRSRDGAPTIIGDSQVMKDLIAEAKDIAPLNVTVLLSGATGTGKDLFAKLIHHESGRSGPLVVVNIASLSPTLIESELFGHRKGAFTGAATAKDGFFRSAKGGTFFLDEIGEAPPDVQAKLLRAIETREIIPVGDTKPVTVDVRLIAATNRDLKRQIDKGRFREDLYHRLRQCEIALPPLSERTEDIPHLVLHFLEILGNGFSVNGDAKQVDALGTILARRDYDGNVRELKVRVAQLLHASKGDISTMLDLALGNGSLSSRDKLLEVLTLTDGNQSEAARMLGVSEGTIRNRIRKFDLART